MKNELISKCGVKIIPQGLTPWEKDRISYQTRRHPTYVSERMENLWLHQEYEMWLSLQMHLHSNHFLKAKKS